MSSHPGALCRRVYVTFVKILVKDLVELVVMIIELSKISVRLKK